MSFVRIGKEVRSPIFGERSADALIGLEALEAARAAPYVSKGSLVLIDTVVKEPVTTLTRRAIYPPKQELLSILSSAGCQVYEIPARLEAKRLGSVRSANLLMLGVFCERARQLPVPAVEAAIKSVLGSKAAPALVAFQRGIEMARSATASHPPPTRPPFGRPQRRTRSTKR